MTSSENRHTPGSQLPAPGKFYENKDFSLDLLPFHQPHPITAGNKALKLRPHLQAAEDLGICHLLTFGGAYSHHLLAVAWTCAERGWKSTGYVRGEELATQRLNPLLESAQACGMELRFMNRVEYRRWAPTGRVPHATGGLVIPEGGGTEETFFKPAEASWFEPYDLVVCAAGTGTTALGLKKLLPHKRVLAALCVHDLSVQERLESNGLEVIHVAGRGFGPVENSRIPELIRLAEETGIWLDPLYTGKVFFGLQDLAQKGNFGGLKTVLLHSGGWAGWVGLCHQNPRVAHLMDNSTYAQAFLHHLADLLRHPPHGPERPPQGVH